MKKFYLFFTLLMAAITLNLNAQFVELDDKDPVFRLTFDGELDSDGRLLAGGTEAFNNFISNDGTLIENDTIKGHAWGGGTFAPWTFMEQIVSSDDIEEMFLPSMHWDSYLSIPDRPQGIAAYSNNNGGYSGPRGTSARTVSFFVYYTDSARVDTAGTAAWGGDHMFFDGGQWDLEGGGGMIRWLLNPANMKMQFDWGLAADFTAENMFSRNEWVHLALTVPDGGARAGVKLYVNGVQQEFVADEATGAETTTLNTTPTAAWDGIRIGRLANVWMADYRVYDTELSRTEINLLLGKDVSSVQNLEKEKLFKIYPVPNDGVFTVETSDTGLSKLIIRNTLGQVVHNQTIEQKEQLDISSLPIGTYFVSVTDSKNNVQTRKILLK